MVDPISAETAEQATFILLMTAVGAAELVACLALGLLRWNATWWAVVGLQAVLFVGALVEGMLTDPQGWIAFSMLPALTLVVLVGLRVLQARRLGETSSTAASWLADRAHGRG